MSSHPWPMAKDRVLDESQDSQLPLSERNARSPAKDHASRFPSRKSGFFLGVIFMTKTCHCRKWSCTKTMMMVMVCLFLGASIAWAGSGDEISKNSRTSTLAPELRSKPFSMNIGLEFQAAVKMIGAERQLRNGEALIGPDTSPAIMDTLKQHRAGMDAPDMMIKTAQPMTADDIRPHRAGMDAPYEAVL